MAARGSTRLAIVVMGVSASGKTVAGRALASLLRLPFVDGDDLHPPANVAKMRGGTPLSDDDRWPWLDRVGAELADGRNAEGVVVACSALRRDYRERIRRAGGPDVRFVHLAIDREEARRRIAARTHHFMPASLIDSQFATLEAPAGEPDVVTIGHLGTPEEVAQDAAHALRDHDGNPDR